MTILRFRMASTVGSRAGASYRPGRKAHAKNFLAKIPRNPLISLDSDERIQGNPRKSNTQKRGFSQPNGQGPRKSKRTHRDRSPAPPARVASERERADRRDEPGNVVLISPGEEHWHGASPTAAMTHVAVNEAPTSWMEKVSDEQYG